MSTESSLVIKPEIDSANKTLTLYLSGDIDVHASDALKALPLPEQSHVIFDFSKVGRINSMGLAQLMRLLEAWRTETDKMEARHMNRMVSMLFKMTGMTRYFGASEEDNTAQTAPQTQGGSAQNPAASGAKRNLRPVSRSRLAQPKLRRISRTPKKTQSPSETSSANTETIPPASGKLSFAVSLQNNQQLSGWYFLNTLLQRELEQAMGIHIDQLGKETHLQQHALVFAKPFEACRLILKHQFIPVVQPLNDPDEVSIIISREHSERDIQSFAQAKVVTATQSSFVFLLGRFLCDESGLDSSKLSYQWSGNEITALRVLLNQQADMLFMLRKHYHQLSRISREATHVLEESDTGIANHMLLLSPQYKHLQSRLTETLVNLKQHEQGQQVLRDLGSEGWVVPSNDEISMLLMLYKRYE